MYRHTLTTQCSDKGPVESAQSVCQSIGVRWTHIPQLSFRNISDSAMRDRGDRTTVWGDHSYFILEEEKKRIRMKLKISKSAISSVLALRRGMNYKQDSPSPTACRMLRSPTSSVYSPKGIRSLSVGVKTPTDFQIINSLYPWKFLDENRYVGWKCRNRYHKINLGQNLLRILTGISNGVTEPKTFQLITTKSIWEVVTSRHNSYDVFTCSEK